MASETNIERVLDLLTKAPAAEVESLGRGVQVHTESIQSIMSAKNVIGVGISEKISDDVPTGKLSLTFYVERKIPLSKLRADQAIPPTVPEALSGPEAIPTDVVVLGKIKPEAKAKKKPNQPAPNAQTNPIQPGYSVGHVNITAGTLGAIVQKDGKLYILSNSHVLAEGGLAQIGDSILYPGPADGGKMPENLIGTLADFKPFIVGGAYVNTADCAIAAINPNRLPDMLLEINGIGLPKGTIAPVRGMKVMKSGRTTGLTEGEIKDVHFRFTLSYQGVGDVNYTDQVLCSRYTAPGDSGSLVIDKDSGMAVGLHFAGGDGKGIFGANGGSVFNPIDAVLQSLGVQLVTTPVNEPQAQPA